MHIDVFKHIFALNVLIISYYLLAKHELSLTSVKRRKSYYT